MKWAISLTHADSQPISFFRGNLEGFDLYNAVWLQFSVRVLVNTCVDGTVLRHNFTKYLAHVFARSNSRCERSKSGWKDNVLTTDARQNIGVCTEVIVFVWQSFLVKTEEQRQKKSMEGSRWAWIMGEYRITTKSPQWFLYTAIMKYLVFGIVSCFHVFSNRNVPENNACMAIKNHEFMLVLLCLDCEHKG